MNFSPKNVGPTAVIVLFIALCLNKSPLVHSACSSMEWECDSGQCIPDDKQCDGKIDCDDRSDEVSENCIHFHKSCQEFAFRCIYGACVNGDAKNNSVQDCADNSDELINSNKDDSDFRGTCDAGEMQCLTSKECIEIELLCNGVANCKDGSDESIEVCINYICNPFGFGFQCGNGACIDSDAKCNGKVECADGSDEAWQLCGTPRKKDKLISVIATPKPTPSPTPSATPKPITKPTPSKGVKCFLINLPMLENLRFKLQPHNEIIELGTAVNEFDTLNIECKNNGVLIGHSSLICIKGVFNYDFPTCDAPAPSKGIKCFLFDSPELQNLRFKLHPHNKTIELGTAVNEYDTLHIECKNRRVLRGRSSLLCVNGTFDNEFPICESFCDGKLLSRLSLRAICDNGEQIVQCPENIAAGTQIQVKCRYGYSRVPNVRQDITCLQNGMFDKVPLRCDMSCGKLASSSASLSKYGIEISVSKAPWHVAIYENYRVEYIYICGGSIISPTIIISAAHCFWDEANQIQKNSTRYHIIAGRSTSNYSEEQTEFSQAIKVLEVQIPEEYGGSSQQQREDIAFLKLEIPLTFSKNITPICLPKDIRYAASRYMLSNRDGMIHGFGAQNQLERVNMKTLAYHDCIHKTPDAPVADDKFCVYTVHGTLVCRGDSGGGFSIGITDMFTGVTHYDLWGVISNTPSTKNDCTRTGDGAYVAITNIFHSPAPFLRKLASARMADWELI